MEEEKVYQALTERVGSPGSKVVPKVWQMLVTPKDGEILLAMPAFAEDLAEKFSINLEELKEKLTRNDFLKLQKAYTRTMV